MAGMAEKCIQQPEAIEVSIVLADDGFVQDLNKRYRDKDNPTNVLSFPQTEEDSLLVSPAPFLSLGDIILAYETVEKEASQQAKSFEEHLRHLIVHSCLHLLHYDHIEEQEAEEMESIEILVLKGMGIKNPYESSCE
jgi:probable rRNA maturation factor